MITVTEVDNGYVITEYDLTRNPTLDNTLVVEKLTPSTDAKRIGEAVLELLIIDENKNK